MGNQAVLDAMEGEKVVHIVDLEAWLLGFLLFFYKKYK